MSTDRIRRFGLWRIALLLAVGAFFVAAQPSIEGSAGRDFSRCIQSCNATRAACKAICDEDCAAMWPNDPAAERACSSACDAVCVDESSECKKVCQAIKDEPSPVEP